MNVGIIIGRLGGADGVALETEKWLRVLERMGHRTFVLTGEVEGRRPAAGREEVAPGLSFGSPECTWEQQQAYFGGDASTDELMSRIHDHAAGIAHRIKQWAGQRRLDVVVVENGCALPFHLSLGVGVGLAGPALDLPIITHDHDFAWERGQRYVSPHPEINLLVARSFPLRLPHSRHAVINSAAREELARRYGRKALVVPNVMDFEAPFGLTDAGNRALPAALGLRTGEYAIFQVTRIVRRKGIEVAIRLLEALDDRCLKLVVTGSPADDPGGEYLGELESLIGKLNLEERVLFAHRRIHNRRGRTADGRPVYSLSDGYAHARACTFFSSYEGFGNAFVECILARKPIFLNNYRPVYWPDIGSKGFRTVMLEDNQLTAEAVEEARRLLRDDALRRQVTEHNFALGKRHFSFQVLEDRLTRLLAP